MAQRFVFEELAEYQQFIQNMGDLDFQYLFFLKEKERRAQHWVSRKVMN